MFDYLTNDIGRRALTKWDVNFLPLITRTVLLYSSLLTTGRKFNTTTPFLNTLLKWIWKRREVKSCRYKNNVNSDTKLNRSFKRRQKSINLVTRTSTGVNKTNYTTQHFVNKQKRILLYVSMKINGKSCERNAEESETDNIRSCKISKISTLTQQQSMKI